MHPVPFFMKYIKVTVNFRKCFHDCVYLMLINYSKIQSDMYLSFATTAYATDSNRLILIAC